MCFKKNLFALLLLIIFVFSGAYLYCQDPPIEWGEIPRSDLEMKTYPPDPNASAVILCDYGKSYFDDAFEIVFERELRIKILNKNGYDLGTIYEVIHSKDDKESIYDIEGITYSLDSTGNVVKKELDDDQIFKEDLDGKRTLYKFTMPGLSPGCVIDVRYKIESQQLDWMRSWTFQWSEPVMWSEYRITFPQQIVYATVTSGFETFFRAEKNHVRRDFYGEAETILGDNVPCVQMRYVVKDAPAIRNIPFITTPDDYKNKVDVQLAAYALPGTGVQKVLLDWKSLCNNRIKSDYFGKKIEVNGDIEDLEKKITHSTWTKEQKIKAIYNWVKNTIVWNGKNRQESYSDLDDLLEAKKGSSADINLLLIALLKSAGAEAYPVLLSTRSNGWIQKVYPIINQFNYVLAMVKDGAKTQYIDATNRLRPMDLLPEKVLNTQGLVVKKDAPEWVTLTSPAADKKISMAEIHLHKDGSMKGFISGMDNDYAALNLRARVSDSKDYKKILENIYDTDDEGITIDSADIKGMDSLKLKPELSAWISSPDYAQQNGDMIYMNPLVIKVLKENPFKSKERKYPVDYMYKRNFTDIINIILPKDYEAKEILPNKIIRFGTNGTEFIRQTAKYNNVIQISEKLVINETEVLSNYYTELRKFYSKIMECESEEMVFAKKKPVPKPIIKSKEKPAAASSALKEKKSKHEKKKS